MAFAGLKKQINKANQVNIRIILLLYFTNSLKIDSKYDCLHIRKFS